MLVKPNPIILRTEAWKTELHPVTRPPEMLQVHSVITLLKA